MILKGLRFSGLFSFKHWSYTQNTQTSAYNKFAISDYNRETMEYTLTRVNSSEHSTELNFGKQDPSKVSFGDRRMYVQAMLDYQHTFNDVHDLNVMFLYNQNQYNVNSPQSFLETLPKTQARYCRTCLLCL